ncbi:rhodanese-like domain-containing protein [Bathymodiolus thermophilus thioautotrophic gill symbiont]|nr:rhodanese-like domain-containing protein [Bathymodiolus thermophilus thioautotrophic gill symbiont]
MMKIKLLLIAATALSLTACGITNTKKSSAAEVKKTSSKPVGIVKDVMEIAGIYRNQNGKNTIHPAFAKTSRPCPPFCIQPQHPFAPAPVDTVTELDIIYALRDIANGANAMVIDARTPIWTTAKKGGTIKGAVNISFKKLNSKAVAKDPDAVTDILTKRFGAVDNGSGVLDFGKAKTLYLFCNGLWCGQSPAAIKSLLTLGYPASKLKYYREGMNAWHSLGLSTVGK